MKKASNIFVGRLGFSLAEVLAALMIAAMVLVAVLSIYSRAQRSAAAITRRLDSSRLPSEVLQRIAEDLDAIVAATSDTKITIENKVVKGYSSARLTIVKTIYDSKNKSKTFEKIIWQTSADDNANGLVLYRSHDGIALEDKLLDEKRKSWEKEFSFVPICAGVTFFKIQVPRGEGFQDKWTSDSLPHGIVVTVSFAEPFKTLAGTLDVPDAEKITRTIAIDRTRKIKFIFIKREDEEGWDEEGEDEKSEDDKGEDDKGKDDKSEDDKGEDDKGKSND